jgi:hypothetical protein
MPLTHQEILFIFTNEGDRATGDFHFFAVLHLDGLSEKKDRKVRSIPVSSP